MFLRISVLFLFGISATAQTTHQAWLQYYNQTRISQHWTLQIDGGYRLKEWEPTAYIARAGMAYSLSEKLKISAGLAHLGTYKNEMLTQIEFRPYQDIEYKLTYPKLEWTQRFRVEERFFKTLKEDTQSFKLRIRYQVMAFVPVCKLSPDVNLLLGVGNEIFLHVQKQGFFDQNRLLISPTIRKKGLGSISLTWNNQWNANPTKGNSIYNSVIWLQLRHLMDVRKK